MVRVLSQTRRKASRVPGEACTAHSRHAEASDGCACAKASWTTLVISSGRPARPRCSSAGSTEQHWDQAARGSSILWVPIWFLSTLSVTATSGAASATLSAGSQ